MPGFWKWYDRASRVDFAGTLLAFIFDWKTWVVAIIGGGGGGGMTFLTAAIRGRDPLDVWVLAVVVAAAFMVIVWIAISLLEKWRRPKKNVGHGQIAVSVGAEYPIHPLFADVHSDLAKLGRPTGPAEAATARTDDTDRSAAQFMHDHATVLWLKKQKIFYRLKTPKGKWNPYRHSSEIEDCKYWSDDWLREHFGTPPADRQFPNGAIAKLTVDDPKKWKWIGWCHKNKSYGLWGDKVFIQEFEHGKMTGPWAAGFDKEAQVFVLFSDDNSWEARGVTGDAPLISETTWPPPKCTGEGPMNIVVTGNSGRIGQKLTAIFAEAGHSIAGIDRQDGHDLSIMGDWQQRFADAAAVVHLAASAHPASSLEDVQRNNVIATGNVVQACMIHRVSRLVFASSTHVALGRYGFPGGTDAPASFYGLSKLYGERLIQLCAEARHFSAASVRIGWVPTAEELKQQPDPWIRSVQVSDEALAAAFLTATLDPFTGYRLIECVGPSL